MLKKTRSEDSSAARAAQRPSQGISTGRSSADAAVQPPFFRLPFFGFGAGNSRAVILTNSLSHAASSILSSINKLGLAPG